MLTSAGPDTEQGDDQAMASMIVCMIILLILFIFFCLLPVLRLIKKRWNHWNQVENDPRWSGDHFQFSARAASSKPACPRYTEEGVPPSYSQIFLNCDNNSLGSPPPYKSVESGLNVRD